MKNVFKVLSIIALVAVIGFSMVSCGGDDDKGGGGGGGLTITNLSSYNGKFVMALEDGDDNGLIAADKVSGSNVTGGKVVNGSVTLKVWKGKSNYTGSDTKSFMVLIYKDATTNMQTSSPFSDSEAFGSVKNVKFTNGVGSGSFSEGFGF